MRFTGEENERKGSLSRLKNLFSASGSRQKSVSDGRKPQHEQTSVQFCSAGAEDCPSRPAARDARRLFSRFICRLSLSLIALAIFVSQLDLSLSLLH